MPLISKHLFGKLPMESSPLVPTLQLKHWACFSLPFLWPSSGNCRSCPFWECRDSISCWTIILSRLGLSITYLDKLAHGNWLTNYINCWASNDFAKAIIASTAWLIWTARCHLVFQHITPNFSKLVGNAWTNTIDFFCANHLNKREFSNHSLYSNSFNHLHFNGRFLGSYFWLC